MSGLGDFVHLHVHSEYSLLDGATPIKQMVERAKQEGMKALAITDHGAMYGVIPFYLECKQAGIKPIIGCEVYLTAGNHRDKPNRREQKIYHLLLLARNHTGYQNLMQLVTDAHMHGFHYKPRIDKKLLQQYGEGLIATSSCLAGEIPQAILNDDLEKARALIQEYKALFGPDHFYLELQDHQVIEQQKVNRYLLHFAEELNVPVVATNDVHYIRAEDDLMHDCLLCIGMGKKIKDEDRLRFPSDQFYLKSTQEMKRLFAHVPEAIENTIKIAEKCHVEIPLGNQLLPRFPLPPGESSKAYLYARCMDGLKARYQNPSDEVIQRLQYELKVIDQMGFNDYFLVVWDFVGFAHQQKIAVGPGRGSAAGSLVAYVLRITNVDPIRYQLLFERFLNPERVTLPDIDIDFNDERRDEVIQYVVNKYGKERVAQVITFGTMAPRAAIRDVGRVLGVDYGAVDRLAKMVPASPGMTMVKAFKLVPQLQAQLKSPQFARLGEIVEKIEGMPRHGSTHAAGVVISDHPLTQYVPLQTGSDGIPLTQYAMESLEQIGLLKVDFLGLRNLSIIEKAIQLVKEKHQIDISFSEDHFDEPATYQLLSAGDTSGVFQMESTGMRRVLRELKPTEFEDIIAILALYRPGPMEQIPRFIRAKHGQEQVHYPHPDLINILKPTYGIIVYQEQIMQIAAQMAGFSLGEADLLRRAVSKKQKKVLLEQRTAFVAGCTHHGYDESVGNEVYDLIVRFANYGFNRSHAAAYGVLAYQTAFLKANHPLAYFTAILSNMIGNQTKLAEYLAEAREKGVAIFPPDINASCEDFTIEKNGIRFGLLAIKNVGHLAIQIIIEERKKQPYVDLADFCKRIDLRICNRRVIESLIQCGACDGLPGHRAEHLAVLDDYFEQHGARYQPSKNQLNLFEELPTPKMKKPDITPYTQSEMLKYEKEYIGVYVSGHPLDRYQAWKKEHQVMNCQDLDAISTGKQVKGIGMITKIRRIQTKKGDQMAFAQVEDQTGHIELVIFPNVYRDLQTKIEADEMVYFTGKLDRQEDRAKVMVQEMKLLEEMNRDEKVFVRISGEQQERHLTALHGIIGKHRGSQPIYLYYEQSKQLLSLPVAKYGIKLTATAIEEMEALLGAGSVKVKKD
ncbi:DNA polymerase III subunit alpha [Hazenella sp. IB182357]|uniref:DNA polymerase III subunit alpha n=1 Tax=Polycladospora coralii TaxID=2771432 RepID=A0A926NBJ8_9BACL|nr:DNA polymerase III subunit alpha [Polycladospora coralii]MBD1373896.1 DNA polymerase III subunit alpha [Polycladospora coralii]MBS7529544.1 DNA polymerase III subunit alpha [Polycladospora coralii]